MSERLSITDDATNLPIPSGTPCWHITITYAYHLNNEIKEFSVEEDYANILAVTERLLMPNLTNYGPMPEAMLVSFRVQQRLA